MIITIPDELGQMKSLFNDAWATQDGRNIYDKIPIIKRSEQPKTKITVNFNFVKGAFAEVLSNKPGSFKVDFKNGDTVLYSTVIEENHWTKCLLQYYIPYTITVTDLSDNEVIFNETIDLKGKKVVVEFGSKSLGDTLAWLPYVDEFQKKHDCELHVVTFQNSLFINQYPNLTFHEPGESFSNINAWYQIGWFYDGDNMDRFKHPNEVKDQPMQKTAADILGLDYTELKPRLTFIKSDSPLGVQRYVSIANHSTAQIKYWNADNGWQTVVDYLKGLGYEVVCVSKEGKEFMGNKTPSGVIYPPDYNIETIMNYIANSEFFVGIGSGLTWLSWALGVNTVLISGFSEPYTEMQGGGIIRIGAPEDCRTSGAFNKFKLDPSKWNWEPFRTPTSEYESSKLITPEIVIEKIQPFINKSTNE